MLPSPLGWYCTDDEQCLVFSRHDAQNRATKFNLGFIRWEKLTVWSLPLIGPVAELCSSSSDLTTVFLCVVSETFWKRVCAFLIMSNQNLKVFFYSPATVAAVALNTESLFYSWTILKNCFLKMVFINIQWPKFFLSVHSWRWHCVWWWLLFSFTVGNQLNLLHVESTKKILCTLKRMFLSLELKS